MKIPYTYTVLRYVHDVVSGEFVNVGVILYAPAVGFLRGRMTTTARRIKLMFGQIDSNDLRDVLGRIERSVERAARGLKSPTLFSEKDDVLTFAERIVPRDDSALQLSPASGGITDDPDKALERLFERYVSRYRLTDRKDTRHDAEILPVFRRAIEERDLLTAVQTKVIESPDYEHRFPLAWKNGIWNACDAVSFDLADPSAIIEKANKWMGRATNLAESSERFRLILLLGEPQRDALLEAVLTAEHIIRKARDLEIVMIRERKASELAEMISRDAAH